MNQNFLPVIGKVLLLLCLSFIGAIAGMFVGAVALPVRVLESMGTNSEPNEVVHTQPSNQDQI